MEVQYQGSPEAPGSKALPQWTMHFFSCFFGFESTQLAHQVQQERTQKEVQ